MKRLYVYILTNCSRTLYTGVTNDLVRRVWEHKTKRIPGFTARYGIDQLVHYELFGEIWDALAREKQIKGWTRAKKIALIEANNPAWDDLADAIREPEGPEPIHSIQPGDPCSEQPSAQGDYTAPPTTESVSS